MDLEQDSEMYFSLVGFLAPNEYDDQATEVCDNVHVKVTFNC